MRAETMMHREFICSHLDNQSHFLQRKCRTLMGGFAAFLWFLCYYYTVCVTEYLFSFRRTKQYIWRRYLGHFLIFYRLNLNVCLCSPGSPPIFIIKALTLHYEMKKCQLQHAFLLNFATLQIHPQWLYSLKADYQQIQLLFCTMQNILRQVRACDSGLQPLLVESTEVRWLQHFP